VGGADIALIAMSAMKITDGRTWHLNTRRASSIREQKELKTQKTSNLERMKTRRAVLTWGRPFHFAGGDA
jgi:hypothetical protein